MLTLKSKSIHHFLQILAITLAGIMFNLVWVITVQSASTGSHTIINVYKSGNSPSENPVPVINSIQPTSTIVGSGAFTLTITGTNFITTSVAQWNDAVRSTLFISPTRLQAAISTTDTSSYGLARINVFNPPPGGGKSNPISFEIQPKGKIFIPLAARKWPPLPEIPILNPIANSDQNNTYSVSWQNMGNSDTFILEESLDASFTNPAVVYQGPSLAWNVPAGGKLPGNYYYRVKSRNQYSESGWSSAQFVRIYPLFVGLKVRYDGNGYIRGSEYYDIGSHATISLDLLTDPDTVRAEFHDWYNPNPLSFDETSYYSYYSVTTGQWKSSSYPGDPSWKWGYSWKLAYDATFTDGDTVTIDGQDFTVTGPHSGYTTYGKAINYWEFTNQHKLLYWDDGGDWKQYVNPGEAVLRYDAGASGLLIYDNITRHFYYQGDDYGDTVQYIENLTAANSLPGSPPVSLTNSPEITSIPSKFFDSRIPGDRFYK
jgi:hypothetical protein